MNRNVLFMTVDQWRGDSLSALGHPVLETPTLDRLAASGVTFANHWANAAPCGPSRACLYTGTYLHRNRSVQNGTPLDTRFTNVARLAREAGYDPVLFGYTDTSADPRGLAADDPRLFSYEGILPGFSVELFDPWEQGNPEWGRWLAAQGVDVPANPHDLYQPLGGFPGSDRHGSTWAPTRFSAEQSPTAFVVGRLIEWLEHHGDERFFVHASFIGPHPPRRCPLGYHDLYDAEQIPPFVAASTRALEADVHPFNSIVMNMPDVGAAGDERERRQTRATYYGAQREFDDRLGLLLDHLATTGLLDSTLVVLTSDHGEMGGDHWLLEKLGYWDESYHVPMIVVDPDAAADGTRGSVVRDFTESVDVVPTICDWIGVETPLQVDGWPLTPFIRQGTAPEHWRSSAHFEWDFSTPVGRLSEQYFGIPSSHCSLAVERSVASKYVQFAAAPDILPPLLFDLESDPWQLENRWGRADSWEGAWEASSRLLQWRMRNDERTLSTHFIGPGHGLVVARDEWR